MALASVLGRLASERRRADDQTEGSLQELSRERENYLAFDAYDIERDRIELAKKLASPEAPSACQGNKEGEHASERHLPLFGDQKNIHDQDSGHKEGLDALMAEISDALVSRSRRWHELAAELPGGAPQPAESLRQGETLASETEALQASLKATGALLELQARMQAAIEQGVLKNQLEIDQAALQSYLSQAKAAILKLQSLEFYHLVTNYRAEELAARAKIRHELETRTKEVHAQLLEAQRLLSMYRGLGPDYHEKLAELRKVETQLKDWEYFLSQYQEVDTELRQQAVEDPYGGGYGHY